MVSNVLIPVSARPARLGRKAVVAVMLLAADALESLLALLDRLGLARGGCSRLNLPSLPVPRRSPPRMARKGCQNQTKGVRGRLAGMGWPRKRPRPAAMKGRRSKLPGRMSGTGFEYDSNGNVVAYTYDGAIRLTASSYPDRGTRRSKTTYAYGSYIDEVLCMAKANGDRFYYSTNDLYSVYALTDSNGTVVERYMYDPYGRVTICNPDGSEKTGVARVCSAYGNPFFFTGRRNDDETRWFDSSKPAGKEWQQGLMQFRFRYYDTGLGRFIGRDPIGYVDGWSLYRGYFSPSSVDPMGLKIGDSWQIAKRCVLMVIVQVYLDFRTWVGQKRWTALEEDVYKENLKAAVESEWNNQSYRIYPARKEYTDSVWGIEYTRCCPCFEEGWKPIVDIQFTGSAKSADWAPTVYRTDASGGPGIETESKLYEGSILTPVDLSKPPDKRMSQTPVSHEFGHRVLGRGGKDHPNWNDPRIPKDKWDIMTDTYIRDPNDKKFAYTTPKGGVDDLGRPVSGDDLMGTGRGFRPFYYEKWRQILDGEYKGCAQHQIR